MTQQNIMQFLKNNYSKYFLGREISEIMQIGKSSVLRNLRKLKKHELVETKGEGTSKNPFWYKWKGNMIPPDKIRDFSSHQEENYYGKKISID